MSERTFRAILIALVLLFVVAIALPWVSRLGFGGFPAGRPATNPADAVNAPQAGVLSPIAPLAPPRAVAPPDGAHPGQLIDPGRTTALVYDDTFGRFAAAGAVWPDGWTNRDRGRGGYVERHPHCGDWTSWEAAHAANPGWTSADWEACLRGWYGGIDSGVAYGVTTVGSSDPGLFDRPTGIYYDTPSPTGTIGAAAVISGASSAAVTPAGSTTRSIAGTVTAADRFERALAYQRRGDLESARLEYRAVLTVNDNDAWAHNNLGVVYQAQGRTGDAIAEFRRAAALDRTYTRAFNNLGSALLQAGRVDEAIGELRWVLLQDSRNAEAMTNLGIALMAVGRREEARELLQAALLVNSTDPRIHYAMAALFEQTGDFVKAIDHYEQFLKYGDQLAPRLSVADRVQELRTWLARFEPDNGKR
jgi:Flp pilus assembly protein TadD